MKYLNHWGVKPNKTWLHFDKIEFDKLEWMLPSRGGKKSPSTSMAARFGFSGELLDRTTADTTVRQALHHHGNEPDSPGYTLDELFRLARSQFNQQRVLALQTLSNVLKKCHDGYYHDLVKSDSDEFSSTALDDEN